MGVGDTVTPQEGTMNPFDRFGLDFDRIKLKISYRNLKFGQNKSLEEEKIYNFAFGWELI